MDRPERSRGSCTDLRGLILLKFAAGYNAAMRIYAAVGALLGWFALALQLYLILVQAPGPERLGAVINYFSFFTILTNILTASVFTAVALQPKGGWGQWLCRPSVQAATAVYIAIVGMVYQLLLRQFWNRKGAQWVPTG